MKPIALQLFSGKTALAGLNYSARFASIIGCLAALTFAAYGQSNPGVGLAVQSWNGYLITTSPYQLYSNTATTLILGTAANQTAPPVVNATLMALPSGYSGRATGEVGTDVAGNIYQYILLVPPQPGAVPMSAVISKTTPAGAVTYINVPYNAEYSSFVRTNTAFYVIEAPGAELYQSIYRLNPDGSFTEVLEFPGIGDNTVGPFFTPTIDSNDNVTYMVKEEDSRTLEEVDLPYIYAAVGAVPYIQPALPTVTSVPLAQNQALSLGISAFSSLSISYQWSYNGVAIDGANQASYNGPFLGAGTYSIIATTSGGTVSSSTQVELTVAGAAVNSVPTFLSDPVSATEVLGSPITLTATAAATEPISFQWYLNGAAISGATSSVPSGTYGYGAYDTNLNVDQPGIYTVVATTSGAGGGSVTSTGATIRVQAPGGVTVLPTPTILVQPTGLSALYANGTITPAGLSVTAVASLPLAYQWHLNGSAIAGAANSSFNATNPGTYTVTVSTPAGAVTSQSAVVTVVTGSGVTVTATPTITTQPQSAGLLFGSGQGLPTLSVSAVALEPMSYQWLLNGNVILGATASTYQTTNAGSYTVLVTSSAGSVTSAPAVVSLANRLTNISGRAQVVTGADVAIAGFVISSYTGASKQVLIRGVGPTLSQYGVNDALSQPVLSVFDSSGQLIASNAGWNGSTEVAAAGAAVGAFPLAPGSLDAALVLDLAPGAYTAQISGADGTTGVALAEVYEVSADAGRLINVSNRAFVGTGSNILIGGCVLAGTQPSTVLIRAVGPGLAQFGLTGTLAQPVLSVYDANGNLVAVNTGWSSGSSTDALAVNNAALSVGAFLLQPGSNDCAVLLTLPPGAYTVQVSGENGSTGIALVELYQVPQ